MSPLKSAGLWLRQSFAFSNSFSSWQERLVLALFLVIAAGLGFASLYIAIVPTLLLWGIYVLAMAICTRQGWLKLFGPVLFYDMVRTARRSRYVVMRLLYASILLAILCFMYLITFSERIRHGGDEMVILLGVLGLAVLLTAMTALILLVMFMPSRRSRLLVLSLLGLTVLAFIAGALLYEDHLAPFLPAGERNLARIIDAKLGEVFFSVFLIVQLCLVVLLTPAYVAGAIAEEKERKTMEFMLATDLLNREIVLSKLLSRLANTALFLLTGLPILSVLQFLGGVDTELMLAGFAATGLTMLGIASLSILFSTLFQKPRDAIGLTYLVMITYVALGTVSFAMTEDRHPLMELGLWYGAEAPTLADASYVLNAGNPVTAIGEVIMAIEGIGRGRAPTTLASELPGVLTRYTYFYIPLALGCIGWSIVRLRAVALAQSSGGTTQRVRWWNRDRPAVGDIPMLWKELLVEGRGKFSWIAIIAGLLLVLLTIGSGILVLGGTIWEMLIHNPWMSWRNLAENMNVWFRIAGTGVACLLMLMVGVRASTAITSERERDTFDALITTPMSAENILASKLLGSILSLRMAWLWFGGMLVLAVVTGGIHLMAVPIVIAAWFIYAVLFALVGLWYSMACQTSMRATVLTVLTTLFLGGGHWLVTGMCCAPIVALMNVHHGSFPEYLLKFQAGMTPPFVLGLCAYSWQDLQHQFSRSEFFELFVFCFIGLALWAAACPILWYGVLVPRFKQITRREELIYD